MPTTPTGFEQYCRDHPTDPTGSPTNQLGKSPSWNQKCVALVFRAGGFSRTASSAYRAAVLTRDAHGLDTRTQLDNIPRGWFPYFDIGGEANGHIGMVTRPGIFLNANWRANNYGTALGELGIQEYINRSGAKYMGASPYFIDTTLDLSTLSGGDVVPIPPQQEDDDMRLALNALGFYTLYTGEGMYVIGNQTNADKVFRALNGGASAGDLNYLDSILYGPRWSWDTAKSSFQPNLPSVLAGDYPHTDAPGAITAKDLAAIGATVDAALADDFAKVGANIEDQPTTFEVVPKA